MHKTITRILNQPRWFYFNIKDRHGDHDMHREFAANWEAAEAQAYEHLMGTGCRITGRSE